MVETVDCATCGKTTAIGGYCEHCGKSLYMCPVCRNAILKEAVYCPRCGVLVSEENKRRLTQRPISWAWWLLPIVVMIPLFSPWVGGVLAWAINRDKNIRQARYILIFSIVLSIILAIILFVYGSTIDI